MNQTKEKISIIIAAYNEEGNIGNTIKCVRAVLPEAEIIVVDDGSTDGTLRKARDTRDELVTVIASPANKGKGHAIRSGIDTASGTIMAQIDADLQFPAEGLPDLFSPIREGKADIVFGSRYLDSATIRNIEQGSVTFLKRLASAVVAALVSIICRQRYTDVFAGFKAWKADKIRDLDLQENGFTYEAEIAIKAHKKGFTVIEVPTRYSKRTSGDSKIKFLYHTFSVAKNIFKLAFFN